MIISIPTNDRETIAVHTGRCKEFAFYEIENGTLISEKFETNTHTHEHGDSCCGRHSEDHHPHHHEDILNIISKADLVLYYAMGKNLRKELEEHQIHFEKAKFVYLKELIDDQL